MFTKSTIRTVLRSLATKANTSSENFAKVLNPKVSFDNLDVFARRHIGPTPKEVQKCYLHWGTMIWMSFIKRCSRTYFDQEKVKCATRKGFY